MTKPYYTADASLIKFLRDFYSIGQLEIIYCTLTDGGVIPGMSDRERAERTDAVAQILGKTPSTEPIEMPKVPQPKQPMNQPETPKMELTKARRLAEGLVARLEDFCDRIHIAGSIRRLKPEVKDIEIVCQPKTWQTGSTGLFDTPTTPVVIPAFRREVEGVGGIGEVLKGKADGRYMQILLPSGIKLDLFMPSAHDYYRQLAIRTGSAEYSAQTIAVGWKKKGWCGTADGLRRIADCEETKSGWKVINPNAELPPYWKSEEEFFAWLGIKWIEPKNRL
ncbi:hypothetical protein [Spirosoma areae]